MVGCRLVSVRLGASAKRRAGYLAEVHAGGIKPTAPERRPGEEPAEAEKAEAEASQQDIMPSRGTTFRKVIGPLFAGFVLVIIAGMALEFFDELEREKG